MMKLIETFDIFIAGKKNGHYSFDYTIGDDFFALWENSEVQAGNLKVHLQMEKKTNVLILNFSILGTINLICDRCLDIFTSPVNLTTTQYVKLAEQYEELDDKTVSIPRNDEKINVSQWIYEAIALSIPISKHHPLDSNGNSSCNPDMLNRIEELSNNHQTEKDPRWEKLIGLLN